MFTGLTFLWTSDFDSCIILSMDCLTTELASPRSGWRTRDQLASSRTALHRSASTRAELPRNRAHRARLQRRSFRLYCGGRGTAKNTRFCETNRIYLGLKTGDKMLRWNRMRSKRVKISIRFVWRGNDIGAYGRRGCVDGSGRDGARPSNSGIRTPPVHQAACQEAGGMVAFTRIWSKGDV